MQQGPFNRLPPLTRKGWTLLVQGVNTHDDAVDALMQEFRFIPDARLDDVMVSYATDGGGVGPHFDSYDVFLLQAHGKRRWRISAQKDLSLIGDIPLKILENFQPEQEFVLEPGDMLYLPPHYAHEGVAIGECMTYSIGFRAPSYQELGEAFLHFMTDTIDLPGRYTDPDLVFSKHPAEIPPTMLSDITTELSKAQFTKEDMAIFLGEYLSEPKANTFFAPPTPCLTYKKFIERAGKRGISLSRKTRMLYRGTHVFINGESFKAKREEKLPITTLADTRRLDGITMPTVPENVAETLYHWYCAGWIIVN